MKQHCPFYSGHTFIACYQRLNLGKDKQKTLILHKKSHFIFETVIGFMLMEKYIQVKFKSKHVPWKAYGYWQFLK